MNEKHDTELDELFDYLLREKNPPRSSGHLAKKESYVKQAILAKYKSNDEVDRLVEEAYKSGYANGGLNSLDMANSAAAKVVADILDAEPKDSKGDIE